MQFDSNRVSLSLRDSYFTVNKNEDGNYILSSLEDRTNNKVLFIFEDTKNFTVSVSEECINLKNGAKSLDITFYEGFYAVLKGNFPLRLLYDDRSGYKAHTAVSEGGKIRICDVKTNSFIWLKNVKGLLKLNSSWIENRINSADVSVETETENGEFEIIVYKTKSIGTADIFCPSFEKCCDIKRSDFKIWCDKMNAQSEIERETAFVLWQNIVAPLGLYKQEAILCNKTHMNAVWGWDNSFHALGVAKAFPKLAFYQLMLIFENADESGALPDSVTPYQVEFGFTKPPVHSFIYEMLMERNPFFCEKEQIEKIYKPLCKNFNWWTSARLNAPVYWRGSVWGCQQVIFAQAAKKAGYLDIAKKIADGYKKSLKIGGSAENGNSLNGSGNCAKAFSWSAAVMFSLDKF